MYLITNQGNGEFLPLQMMGISGSISSIADFNNDSFLDLVIIHRVSNITTMKLLLNDGIGNFTESETKVAVAKPTDTVDYNHDEWLDFIYTVENDLVVSLNQNGELLNSHITLIEDYSNDMLFIGAEDLNQDDKLDIIFYLEEPSEIIVYKGLGDDEFLAESFPINTAINSYPYDFEIDDLDEDGYPDVFFLLNNTNGGIYRMRNIAGQLQPADAIYADPFIYSYELKDINGDELVDVVLTTDDKIFWMKMITPEIFTPQTIQDVSEPPYSFPPIYYSYLLSAADLDNDNDIDIIFSGGFNDRISWYENEESGNFGPYSKLTRDFECWGEQGEHPVVFGQDIDLDGNIDLFIQTHSSDQGNVVLHNNGNINSDFSYSRLPTYLNELDRSMELHDFNGDDHVDIITQPDDLSIFTNLGDFEFENYPSRTSLTAINAQTILFDVSDFDSDNDLDVVSFSPSDQNTLTLHLNDGNGVFSNSLIQSLPFLPDFIDVFDINNDGKKDILLSEIGSESIFWVKNIDNQSYEGISLVAESLIPAEGITHVDINLDGLLDIVAYSKSVGVIFYFLNLSEGQFSEMTILESSFSDIRQVEISDVNYDGNLDIVVASNSASSSDIMAYLIQNSNNLYPETIYNSEQSIASFTLADFDSDGKDDIVFSNTCVSTRFVDISLLRNISTAGCFDEAACNYDSGAQFDNGQCCYNGCGCLDINATNYDETATCENDNCEYNTGCTDINATNHDDTAFLDDGSCSYDIEVFVFFDENENGTFDGEDYYLTSQRVHVTQPNITLITGDLGNSAVSAGNTSLTLQLIQDPLFPFSSTPSTQYFNPISYAGEPFYFGISNEVAEFEFDVSIYAQDQQYRCDEFVPHNIIYRNTGNEIVDGIIAFDYDELFQEYAEVDVIDSIVDGTLYLSFENLLPGEIGFKTVELRTPTVDQIGEFLSTSVEVTGFYENEEVSFGEKSRNLELACAYDPNDKQVFPIGWRDEHFIQNDTILEYLIRFQNIGNAAALNITVKDTLDQNLDLDSFNLLTNSHEIMTSINEETREIEFFFENINLIDSMTNEPESHGFVSFEVRPLDELAALTQIQNKAYIYFDNNPPIITNTTLNTIFGCEQMTLDVTEGGSICQNEVLELTTDYEYVEHFSWILDENILGESSEFSPSTEEIGTFNYLLEYGNPFCSNNQELEIQVVENPSVSDITFENGTLNVSATNGDSFQWFLNGEEITNTTNQIHIPIETGNYSVEVSNDFGCTTSSEVLLIDLSLTEHTKGAISLYPNPMVDKVILDLGNEQTQLVQIFDSNGKLVREYAKINSNQLTLKSAGP